MCSERGAKWLVCRAAILALACMLSGCWVHYSDKNAPGLVQVTEKPEGLPVGQAMHPADPGEHVVSLLTGPFFTAGSGDGNSLLQLGFEATLQYNERESSHIPGIFGAAPGLIAGQGTSWGANLGWTMFDWGAGESNSDFGAFYLEAQVRGPAPVLAAGYAVEPGTDCHGPQFTLSLLGMNWLRINANLDGSYAVMYGVTIKAANIFVWSR